MSTIVHVPPELAARLDAAAARRGVDVDALSVQLLAAGLENDDELEAFIGSGHSGRDDLGRNHRQITAALTGHRAARDL